jgi:hypothetical protein
MTNLDFVEAKLKADQAEYDREKRLEENRLMAEEAHDVYQALVNAGFSDDQAWKIFEGMMATALNAL